MEIWILIAIGFLIVLSLAKSYRTYRGIFSLDHYREVAVALESLRRDASERPSGREDEPAAEQDPLYVMTSKAMTVSYSISEDASAFEHHIGISTPSTGRTSHAAGQIFVSFIIWRMGIDPTQCVSFKGPVAYHLVFHIDGNEEAAFLGAPLALPDDVDMDQIRAQTARVRDKITFEDATREKEQAQNAIESRESSIPDR